MSTFIDFDGYEEGGIENEKSIFNALCICGHELYRHGFVPGTDIFSDEKGFWVSQCVSCPIVDGEFTCDTFELLEVE